MDVMKLFKLFAIMIMAASGGVLLVNHSSPAYTAQTAILPHKAPVARLDKYGIDLARYSFEEQKIDARETLTGILAEQDLSPEAVNLALQQLSPVLNIQDLKEGQTYRVYHRGEDPEYVVLHEDPVHYVVLDLRDSVAVYTGERPVVIEEKVVGAVVETSPAEALAEEGADPALALSLSKIFSWQIDFFRVRKGDHFKLVYEQKLVDGVPIGIGNVLSAKFNYDGDDYFAFRFELDGRGEYFDEYGFSLRQDFLRAPLQWGRITSEFSGRRFHPVQKRWKPHLGTDYAAPKGTEIMAVGDGVIEEAGFQRWNGNYVKIRHNDTYSTGYLHMSRIAPGIRPGVEVEQGQVIGYVGSTGLATGPHVCFRYWKNGEQIDPRTDEQHRPVRAIEARYRKAFKARRDHMMDLLEDTPPIPLFSHLPDVSDLVAQTRA